jgi:hypothetical protein
VTYQGNILNDFLLYVLRVEFGSELELQGILFLNILAHDLQQNSIVRIAAPKIKQPFVD